MRKTDKLKRLSMYSTKILMYVWFIFIVCIMYHCTHNGDTLVTRHTIYQISGGRQWPKATNESGSTIFSYLEKKKFHFVLNFEVRVVVVLHLLEDMAERYPVDQQQTPESQMQSPSSRDDMIACVMALEAALLPCLPARELQAIDRSAHPYHQIDVERHARDFMEAAKKLQLYLIGLQRDDLPSKPDMLRKEIAKMEEELKTKSELITKQERLIQNWREELKGQLDKHNMELERV